MDGKEKRVFEVTPQLRSEILFSESGWSLRRKLEAAPLKDEQKGGCIENDPFSTTRQYPYF
jgi:hypothetical protein